MRNINEIIDDLPAPGDEITEGAAGTEYYGVEESTRPIYRTWCTHCGTTFAYGGGKRRFCSTECSVTHHRRLKATTGSQAEINAYLERTKGVRYE